MSRKKGLSADEKMLKMKQVFLDSADVFTLKEVEKVASKAIPIHAMQVKDLLQQVVDEGWVTQEKIGTSNYYWAFKSQDINQKRVRVAEQEEQVKALKKKKTDLQEKSDTLGAGREESAGRAEKLKELAELRARNAKVKEELQKYSQNDPDYIKALEQGSETALEAANRWTDNVFSLRSWFENTMNVAKSDFHNSFDIPDEFDYVS